MTAAEQGSLFSFDDPADDVESPPDVPFDPADVDPTLLGSVELVFSVDPDADADAGEDGEENPRVDPSADVSGAHVVDVADVAEVDVAEVDVAEVEVDAVDADDGPGVDAVEGVVDDTGGHDSAPDERASVSVAPSREVLAPVDEPDPRLWASVVAQSKAVAQLRASVRAPVHAYLFVGPSGSGAFESAIGFGAALLCPRGGCAQCDVCVRGLAQLHPDLLVIEREGASISVDKAREIIRLATRSPVESNRKVLVLVDFHLVTNAGPALLKIIEEPPASTVFVILAEHVPRELVTIASRCVQVPFGAVPFDTIIDVLVAEGADAEHAARAARASAGRLDRARLLVTDDSVGRRLKFWEGAPHRLDGTGAAVAVMASEAVTMLDSAAVEPLEARQRAEVEALEARLEAAGGRAGIGVRKELAERHKRELKRLRDDELRFGLSVLQRVYRGVLVAGASPNGPAIAGAIAVIAEANRSLERNPNVTLLLQNLLLALPTLR